MNVWTRILRWSRKAITSLVEVFRAIDFTEIIFAIWMYLLFSFPLAFTALLVFGIYSQLVTKLNEFWILAPIANLEGNAQIASLTLVSFLILIFSLAVYIVVIFTLLFGAKWLRESMYQQSQPGDSLSIGDIFALTIGREDRAEVIVKYFEFAREESRFRAKTIGAFLLGQLSIAIKVLFFPSKDQVIVTEYSTPHILVFLGLVLLSLSFLRSLKLTTELRLEFLQALTLYNRARG